MGKKNKSDAQSVQLAKVEKAYNELVAAGLPPSVRAVVKRTGGSNSIIGPMLQSIRRKRLAEEGIPQAPQSVLDDARCFAEQLYEKVATQAVSELNKRVNRMTSTLNDLEEEISQAHQDYSLLSIDSEKLAKDGADLKQRLAAESAEVSSLRTQIKSVQSEITGLRTTIDVSDTEIKLLREELNDERLAHQRAADKLEFSLAANNKVLQELDRQKSDVTMLEGLRAKAEAESMRDAVRIEDLHADLERSRADLKKTRIDLEQTRADLERSRADLKQTRTDLEQTRAEGASYKDQFTAAMNGIAVNIRTIAGAVEFRPTNRRKKRLR